jgi:hypothetical protein
MKYLLVYLLVIIVLISCQEEVEIESAGIAKKLVVNGSFTNQNKIHSVKLLLSGDLSSNPDFEKVRGAIVSIVDTKGSAIRLRESSAGLYLTDSIAGVVGEVYTLIIEWEGKVFRASDSLTSAEQSIIPIKSIPNGAFKEYEFRRHKFGLNYSTKEVVIIEPSVIKTNIDTARAGLSIGVKLLQGGAYQFTSFNHPKIEVNGLLNFEDGKYFGFKEGAEVTHQLFSISTSYYDYLRSMFIETEWQGTLFDTPPANVIGNVDNGALGYFSAHEVEEDVYFLN